MYDNLARLEMTGDVTPEGELQEWALAMATELTERFSVPQEVVVHGTACMVVGFQYGIAYGREFGIPDGAKGLLTLKD